MKAFSNGTFSSVGLKATLVCGDLIDVKVEVFEAIVCDYYKVTKLSLKDWVVDSEAKLMLCFLLHHKLRYSIGSLANTYNVNVLFLRNNVLKIYESCLLDASKKVLVDNFCELVNDGCKV